MAIGGYYPQQSEPDKHDLVGTGQSPKALTEHEEGDPYLGFRIWLVKEGPLVITEQWFLNSVVYNQQWPHQKRAEATHRGAAVADTGHASPNPNPASCACGFYGYYEMEDAIDETQIQIWLPHKMSQSITKQYPVVLGWANFWGNVNLYERGLRAQYAYPYSLYLPGYDGYEWADDFPATHELAKILRDSYAVDVELGYPEGWPESRMRPDPGE